MRTLCCQTKDFGERAAGCGLYLDMTKPTDASLEAIYRRCHGKVFEVLFANDARLIATFLDWVKETHPSWDEEASSNRPSTRAIQLETLLVDEEDEATFLAFFPTLPDAQRRGALAAMMKLADETSPA